LSAIHELLFIAHYETFSRWVREKATAGGREGMRLLNLRGVPRFGKVNYCVLFFFHVGI